MTQRELAFLGDNVGSDEISPKWMTEMQSLKTEYSKKREAENAKCGLWKSEARIFHHQPSRTVEPEKNRRIVFYCEVRRSGNSVVPIRNKKMG